MVNHDGEPYDDDSERANFIARKGLVLVRVPLVVSVAVSNL